MDDAVAIAAWGAVAVAVIGAFFTGMVQLRSIHKLVNARASKQDQKIDELQAIITGQAAAALQKSEAREVPLAKAIEAMSGPDPAPLEVLVVNPPEDPANVQETEKP